MEEALQSTAKLTTYVAAGFQVFAGIERGIEREQESAPHHYLHCTHLALLC